MMVMIMVKIIIITKSDDYGIGWFSDQENDHDDHVHDHNNADGDTGPITDLQKAWKIAQAHFVSPKIGTKNA